MPFRVVLVLSDSVPGLSEAKICFPFSDIQHLSPTMKDKTMDLRNKNLLLSIICIALVILVLGLIVWMWFDNRIDGVNHEMYQLQKK
jgi:hypothetical protein